MKKTLTMTAVVAAAALTLSACTDSGTTSADPNSDAGADATGISDEQLAALDEVNPDQIDDKARNADEVDIPLRVTHLHGKIKPDRVSILCIGDYAFLHTWTSERARNRGIEANATTVRFTEHDELCAQAQS